MAGRYGQAANFAAQSAVWKAKRNFSQQIQGSTAALGVFGGAFNGGGKPMEQIGMSGMGMLGASNKGYFQGFGAEWQSQVGEAAGGLTNGSHADLKFEAGGQKEADATYKKYNPAANLTLSAANTVQNAYNGAGNLVNSVTGSGSKK